MKIILLILLTVLFIFTGYSSGNEETLPKPLPTPPPEPFDPYNSPPNEFHKQGIPLEGWVELFLHRVWHLNIPFTEGGPQKVADYTNREHEGLLIETEYRYTTYWMRIGGVELFLRTFEDETITDIYLHLEYVFSDDKNKQETQLYYYPLIMQACIYACEEGNASQADIDLIISQLSSNIYGDVYFSNETKKSFLLNWPEYTFECLRIGKEKHVMFSANWLR